MERRAFTIQTTTELSHGGEYPRNLSLVDALESCDCLFMVLLSQAVGMGNTDSRLPWILEWENPVYESNLLFLPSTYLKIFLGAS